MGAGHLRGRVRVEGATGRQPARPLGRQLGRERVQGGSQLLGVAGRYEHAVGVVEHHLRQPTDPAGQHRPAAGQRFERHQPEPLAPARHDQQVGALQPAPQLLARLGRQQPHPLAERGGLLRQAVLLRTGADQLEAGVQPVGDREAQRVQQDVEALLRREPAGGQQAHRRRRLYRHRVEHPGDRHPQHLHLLGGQAEDLHEGAPQVFGHDGDHRGPAQHRRGHKSHWTIVQQMYIAAMQGQHERSLRDSTCQQGAEPGRQPPVGVQHVGTQPPGQPQGRQREGGEEHRHQQQPADRPGPSEQPAAVGQPLQAVRAVPEAVHLDPVEPLAPRGTPVVRGEHRDVEPGLPLRPGQVEQERRDVVVGGPRERGRQVQDLHRQSRRHAAEATGIGAGPARPGRTLGRCRSSAHSSVAGLQDNLPTAGDSPTLACRGLKADHRGGCPQARSL